MFRTNVFVCGMLGWYKIFYLLQSVRSYKHQLRRCINFSFRRATKWPCAVVCATSRRVQIRPKFGYFVVADDRAVPSLFRCFVRLHSVGGCWLIDYVVPTIRLCAAPLPYVLNGDGMCVCVESQAHQTPCRIILFRLLIRMRSFIRMNVLFGRSKHTKLNEVVATERIITTELLCLPSTTVGHLKLIIASFFA